MKPDCIEKSLEIDAPVTRVWHALTDYREFGEWFGVRLEGPFRAGEESLGGMTHPGYEDLPWRAVIQEIDPEQYFAFTWHPYAIDPKVDYSEEVPTLVEFRLQPSPRGGTFLELSECGFNDLPDARAGEALRRNEAGWTQQLKNIAAYVAQHPVAA
jgi:uncharacterized protein YndB with AHSA1/START domain